MKALTWKALFASMNPSPVFEGVAMFAEGMAISGDESHSYGPCVRALSKRAGNERSRAKEADFSSKRSAACCASQPTRIASKRNAQSVRMSG
jgi:hypothetical protein